MTDPHRGSGARRHLCLHVAVVIRIRRGCEPTHDLQLARAVRHKLFKDVGEVLANVRERAVDRFVFALIERLNELLLVVAVGVAERARAREKACNRKCEKMWGGQHWRSLWAHAL